MHRVAARLDGHADDLRRIEVGRRARTFDANRLVGLARVERRGGVVWVDGHGLDAEFGGGTHHANRDLAPVRDQQSLDSHTPVPRLVSAVGAMLHAPGVTSEGSRDGYW